MKTTGYLGILFLLTFTIGCDAPVQKAIEEQPVAQRGPKEGEWISRRNDGTIKTRVTYKNGLKHGKSYLFYDDGKTIQLEMPYVVGARHGVSKKYFRDGELYAETSYEEDLLHGKRTTFYRNGKIKSEITYQNGNPGSDLQEYLQDGKTKSKPTIEYELRDNRLYLSIEPKMRCEQPRIFIGELKDGYFDKSNDLEEILTTRDEFIIDLQTYSKSYLALQDIICRCSSSQGNPLVISRRVEL